MKFDPLRLRADFPALERRFSGKPPVYLDNSCVTLRPRQVVEAMDSYYYGHPACHKRAFHKFGAETTERFSLAREKVRGFIGAKSASEIIFLRNTTEGINLLAAVLPLKAGDIVLTSELEHNSNYLPWQVLAAKKGVEHRTFQLAPDLSFDPDLFKKSLVRGVKLVSVAHKSHVTGCVLPVAEVARLAHQCGALVLVDGAQSAGCLKTDVAALGADFLVFSAHKMLGPSGFGALYGRKEELEKLPMFLCGGGTVADAEDHGFAPEALPERFEAGLQDYAGAEGLAAAIDYLEAIGLERAAAHAASLNLAATEALASVKGLEIIGPKAAAPRTGTLNFYVKGADSASLAALLDKSENIMVRAGAHCAHPWYNRNGIPPSLRAAFYFYNTAEEAALFADTLKLLLKNFY